MPQLRLVGLVLFITSVFLGMAAATTHTTHIRFKRLGAAASEMLPPGGQTAYDGQTSPNGLQGPSSGAVAIHQAPGHQAPGHQDLGHQAPGPSGMAANQPVDTSADKLQFVAIPVIYPLAFSSILGLLLWFVPAPVSHTPASRRRRRRRRR